MYLNEAYKKIKERIKNTEEYLKYVGYITGSDDFKDKFKEATSYEKDGKIISFASSVIENVDFINAFSNAFNLDNKFSNMVLKTFENDNILNKVINIKFVETLYGNPNKEDLSNIDAIFIILESVFGLDTIIKSVNDDLILDKRFKSVLNVEDETLEYEFLTIINEIYNQTIDKDYDSIKNIISDYNERLNPFISRGIIKQIDEQLKKDENFNNVDKLRIRVEELMKVGTNKKM